MTKHTEDRNIKTAKLIKELPQFQGDLMRLRNSLNPSVIYTLGVRHLAEEAEAYWLIDAIASWIGSKPFNDAAGQDERISHLHFWTLEVDESGSAVLFAKADSPCERFIEQNIGWTDFPLQKIDIWAGFDGSYWTLHLPSEH